MINQRVLPGLTGREPFRRAGTFQGLSVIVEFLMSEHSVQGISNFSHVLEADKVSDKAADKERKINPTPNSKMSKLQALSLREREQQASDWCLADGR